MFPYLMDMFLRMLKIEYVLFSFKGVAFVYSVFCSKDVCCGERIPHLRITFPRSAVKALISVVYVLSGCVYDVILKFLD